MSKAATTRALLLGIVLATGGAPAAAETGHWTSIGPGLVTAPPIAGLGAYNAVGRLTAIAVDPSDPQIIYVGSAGQLGHEGTGVWKTTDGGQAWAPIADDLPTLSIGAIAIDPTNPNRVYIVTPDEGLFRSDDAGGAWIHLYGDLQIRTNTRDGDRVALLIHPTSPNVLYLTSELGVLRSSDGGLSWPVSLSAGPVAPGNGQPGATSLVMDPLNPNVLYAAIVGKGIYKTTTGGVPANSAWSQQTQSPLPFDTIRTDISILLAISHPASAASEIVYALVPTNPTLSVLAFDLFRTTDGTTWSKHYSCTKATDPECFFIVMGVDPVDWRIAYLGGPLFWVSQDGGDTFTRVPASLNDRQPASPHGDYWELAIDPLNAAVLYVGSDGGFYRSSNHGLEGSWAFRGEGITNVEMYDLALANMATPRAIAGTQDNGNIRYDGNLVWDHIPPNQTSYLSPDPCQDGTVPCPVDLATLGGDGGGVASAPDDPDRFYAVFDNRGTLSVSADGGATFADFSTGIPQAIRTSPNCAIWDMTFQIQVHPANPQTLLASCQSLWRTTTAVPLANWVPIFQPASQLVIRSAVDPALDIYYAGTDRGRLFAGPGGTGFQEVFVHPDLLNVSDIELDSNHTDTVFVAFAPPFAVDRNCPQNAGTRRVYELTRLAPLPDVSVNAVDITTDLPLGLCINALAVDPQVPRTLYAATNKGVYRGRRNASGGPWVWESYNDGMPPADVRDLEVHPATGHMFAATFGRGALKVTPETTRPVSVDIKPGGSPNSINSKSEGNVAVAILSSPTFDAPLEVDFQSLTFGHTGTETSLLKCNKGAEDANGDGLLDKICHFATALTGFQLGDTHGILKGVTVEGTPIVGSDSVRIVK
jgi:hypothetical protein